MSTNKDNSERFVKSYSNKFPAKKDSKVKVLKANVARTTRATLFHEARHLEGYVKYRLALERPRSSQSDSLERFQKLSPGSQSPNATVFKLLIRKAH